jgi:xanthine dehydrogenase small subunit
MTAASPLPPADAVRFVLDGAVHVARGVPPTRTVLQYLREDLGRTGTKEGCAEGDCGACTVVVAEPAGDGLRYRAVNACIQFVPTLDGKALFTVESLAGPGGALHPAQQAMVDCHASQCGFCTPGFVMSLFALHRNVPATPDRATIDDALAGNLCRCTGYRPIVDAARAMYALPTPAGAPNPADDDALLERLRSLGRPRGVAFESPAGRFFAPRTLDELARVREALPAARLVAGSTDVGLWVTKQLRDLGDLIHVGGVAALATVTVGDRFIDIGAAVTVTDAMPALVAAHPDFAELLRRYGSPPIRNAATLGGNVANGSPIGDSMPALIALGTEIVLRKGATTRTMPLEDFYLDYQKNALAAGEFVERLRVPVARPGQRLFVGKVTKRFDQDISAVCGAFAVEVVDGRVTTARIAFGGMAATPRRAPGAERALVGASWDEAGVRAAMHALDADFTPLDDMRASAGYRRRVARNLLLRAVLESRPQPPLTRLYALKEVPA